MLSSLIKIKLKESLIENYKQLKNKEKNMYIPIITGPTGTGKTKISIELAKKINGEIISADSMQIYKDMDIGTAKIKKDEMENITHHMISIISPKENFSVSDFNKKILIKIEEIFKKGKIPIIVGGTGLYINSLVYGIKHQETYDEKLRKVLNEEAEDEEKHLKMYELAKSIDEEEVKKIPFNDKKRIIRIIEIYKLSGKKKSEIDKLQKEETKHNFKIFALSLPRDFQYKVIEDRVDEMVDDGLILENINIFNKYFKDFFKENNIYLPENIDEIKYKKKEEQTNEEKNKEEIENIKEKIEELKKTYTSMQAIGYKEILPYILGIEDLEDAISNLKKATRRYSKRQYTWFRKNNPIWIDVLDIHSKDEKKAINKINEIVLEISKIIKE